MVATSYQTPVWTQCKQRQKLVLFDEPVIVAPIKEANVQPSPAPRVAWRRQIGAKLKEESGLVIAPRATHFADRRRKPPGTCQVNRPRPTPTASKPVEASEAIP